MDEQGATDSHWPVRLGAWLAPLLALTLWIAPLPLAAPAHRLAALASAILVLWVTEALPLPVTSLLLAPALVLAQIVPAKAAFAPFADPILFLFVGSFFAARAMAKHGLDRRLARALVRLRWVRGRASRVRAALLVSVMLVSMWISNTAATAILLPVFLGMLPQRSGAARTPFAAGTVLALAHGSTTGGLATLVGTPPNAITARLLDQAGHHITFLRWMTLGIPVMLALTLLLFVLLSWFFPSGDGTIAEDAEEGSKPWSRAERVTALSFSLAVLGWVLPDVAVVLALPFAESLGKLLDPGAVAIAASSILFMVPEHKGGPRVLRWDEATQIEWGLILLFGGGIALGEAMMSTGLANALGSGLVQLTGANGLWSLTFVSLLLAIVLTEVCSNTAAANMLVPLVIGAAQELGVSPVAPAMAVGLGASCGFMLPVATGPNALVYGTSLLSANQMVRIGILLDLGSALVIFALLRLLAPFL